MQFNSVAYFALLLAALIAYYRLTWRAQNLFLVLVSYLFYAAWDWRFCGLMAFATAIGFYPALAIRKAHDAGNESLARRHLTLSVGLSLVVLGFFKYYNFFVDALHLEGWHLNIILPAGISFYIFHTISYVVDVYRKQLDPTPHFSEIALFLAFFPQLIAGPIARASSLLPQCQRPRVTTQADFNDGIILILIGLVRKVVIADTAGQIVDQIYGRHGSLGSGALWAGVVLYSIQIYNDFAGYSDLARGSAKLFGFDLIVNFRHPYFAANMSEFWKRWHISLSSWLRDYLYIPLGGSRKGSIRTYVNLALTMLIGGLWHGADWKFVLWGAIHGLLLMLHHGLAAAFPRVALPRWLCTASVFLMVSVAWITFRAPDFSTTVAYMQGLVRPLGPIKTYAFYTLLLAGASLLIDLPQVRLRHDAFLSKLSRAPRFAYACALALMLWLGGDLPSSAFIYFQF